MLSSIIVLLVILAAIGLVAYLLTAFIPMPPPIVKLIWIVAVIACLLIVCNAFGVFDGGSGRLAVPRIR